MMSRTDGKRLLVIMRHSPYGSSIARASIDTVLAMAVFEQPVSLLFAGDGALQLLPGQDCEEL
jgi:tRNA 2-thiouridine synthesizing protein C